MKWTESTWFKNLCMAIVAIFFSQSVQPMTFGFAPLTSGPIHAKTRQVPVKLASKHLGGKDTPKLRRVLKAGECVLEMPLWQGHSDEVLELYLSICQTLMSVIVKDVPILDLTTGEMTLPGEKGYVPVVPADLQSPEVRAGLATSIRQLARLVEAA